MKIGGRGGIRTHGELAPSPVFKFGTLDPAVTCSCTQTLVNHFIINALNPLRARGSTS